MLGRLLLVLAILLGPVAAAPPATAVPAHARSVAAAADAPAELAVLARSDSPQHQGSSLDPLTARPGAGAAVLPAVVADSGCAAAPTSRRTEVFRERAPPR